MTEETLPPERAGRRLWLAALVTLLLLASGCGGGRPSKTNGSEFRPGVVAIPHAFFDPSEVDTIARRARYSAWIELDVESVQQILKSGKQEVRTLDLAVWPSRSAARRALAQYRAGGPNTRRHTEDVPLPRKVRRVERIRNVTLAWYYLPTTGDEKAVKGALRFKGGTNGGHDYTALWVMPGTLIDPDATAATAPALYSASLQAVGVPGCPEAPAPGPYVATRRCPGAVAQGRLIVAIWPSESAAKRYVQQDAGFPGPHPRRIRNATLETPDLSDTQVSDADQAAVENALH